MRSTLHQPILRRGESLFISRIGTTDLLNSQTVTVVPITEWESATWPVPCPTTVPPGPSELTDSDQLSRSRTSADVLNDAE